MSLPLVGRVSIVTGSSRGIGAAVVRRLASQGANVVINYVSNAGAAQSVAIVLDRADWPDVVGTLSGDDTIFVATASAATQRRLLARLHDKLRA